MSHKIRIIEFNVSLSVACSRSSSFSKVGLCQRLYRVCKIIFSALRCVHHMPVYLLLLLSYKFLRKYRPTTIPSLFMPSPLPLRASKRQQNEKIFSKKQTAKNLFWNKTISFFFVRQQSVINNVTSLIPARAFCDERKYRNFEWEAKSILWQAAAAVVAAIVVMTTKMALKSYHFSSIVTWVKGRRGWETWITTTSSVPFNFTSKSHPLPSIFIYFSHAVEWNCFLILF
jgi:hypothetical protein